MRKVLGSIVCYEVSSQTQQSKVSPVYFLGLTEYFPMLNLKRNRIFIRQKFERKSDTFLNEKLVSIFIIKMYILKVKLKLFFLETLLQNELNFYEVPFPCTYPLFVIFEARFDIEVVVIWSKLKPGVGLVILKLFFLCIV